ncbi:MAG: hypothetical protein ACJAZ0_002031 [Halioglobus sp.]|jgi:hypothetical protein
MLVNLGGRKVSTVNLRIVRIGLVALSILVFSHASQARLPDNEFACQVNIAGAKLGLVLVQADDKHSARVTAQRAPAWEMGGTQSPGQSQSKALSVVECIDVASERFRDSWFQKFYDDFEM